MKGHHNDSVSGLFLKASGTLNFSSTLPNIAIYLLFIIVQKKKDCFVVRYSLFIPHRKASPRGTLTEKDI